MLTKIELLQKIAENTSNNSSLYIAWVAGGSAVAGAFLTAVLSYLGIRQTIKSQHAIEQLKLQATIVSTERLRWLQDIRVRVADVYAKMDMQFNLLQRYSLPQRYSKSNCFDQQKELDALSREIMLQVGIIHLMLNPEKDAQSKLRNELQSKKELLLDLFSDLERAATPQSYKTYQQIKQRAFNALTEISAETWRQVKALQ